MQIRSATVSTVEGEHMRGVLASLIMLLVAAAIGLVGLGLAKNDFDREMDEDIASLVSRMEASGLSEQQVAAIEPMFHSVQYNVRNFVRSAFYALMGSLAAVFIGAVIIGGWRRSSNSSGDQGKSPG
ncbi:MAG: hypothetical protein KY475_05145 [Planctomycetes bacterium]|nr:hypothetical protein [Planctomycetota bacterium]